MVMWLGNAALGGTWEPPPSAMDPSMASLFQVEAENRYFVAVSNRAPVELSITLPVSRWAPQPETLVFPAFNDLRSGTSLRFVDNRVLASGAPIQVEYSAASHEAAQAQYIAALSRAEDARDRAEQQRAAWEAVPYETRVAEAQAILRKAGIADELASQVVQKLVDGLPVVHQVPCPDGADTDGAEYAVCQQAEDDVALQIAGGVVRVALYRQALVEANRILLRPPFERAIADAEAEQARLMAARAAEERVYAAANGAENEYSHLFRQVVLPCPTWDEPGGTMLGPEAALWLSAAALGAEDTWGPGSGPIIPLDAFGARFSMSLPGELRLGKQTYMGSIATVGARRDRYPVATAASALQKGAQLPSTEYPRVVATSISLGPGVRLAPAGRLNLELEGGVSALVGARLLWETDDSTERSEPARPFVDLPASTFLAPYADFRLMVMDSKARPIIGLDGKFTGLVLSATRSPLLPGDLGITWPDEPTHTARAITWHLAVTRGTI